MLAFLAAYMTVISLHTSSTACREATLSKTTHLLLLVAPGRLVRKHIAYQNIEGIAKKGKCNCGRMLKDGEGNCWHDKRRKLYPGYKDHVVPQTPSRLSRANQEVHLDSACAAQLG